MNDDQLHDRFSAAGRPAGEPSGPAADPVPGIDSMWATARRRRRNRRALGAASVAAVLLVAGVAVAVVPDRDGGGSERVASRSAGEEAACRAIHRVLVPDGRVIPGGAGTEDEMVGVAGASLASLVDGLDLRLHAYLSPDLDDGAAASFAARLEVEAGVIDVEVVTRTQAMEEFRELFADQPAMLESVTASQLQTGVRVEVGPGARELVADRLRGDDQVTDVRDGADILGYVISGAAYLEGRGLNDGLDDLRSDLGAVGRPWAEDLLVGINRAIEGDGVDGDLEALFDLGAVERIVGGVKETVAMCPDAPDGPVPPAEDPACSAVARSVFPGTTGPGDAPTTLAHLLDDYDLRVISIEVDKAIGEDAEAAFLAALAARPDAEVLYSQGRAESRDTLEGAVHDPDGAAIADLVAQGSAVVRVELADRDTFSAWIESQPGDHAVSFADEDTTYVTGWLAAATSGEDPTKVAAMAASQDELRRSGLVWAADLASLIDEAATHDGPFGVDPGRLQRIAEGVADASEACGS